MNILTSVVTILFTLTMFGCADGTKPRVQSQVSSGIGKNITSVAAVEIPDSGTTMDPAVAPSKIPTGAWYCDMGTVHYARGRQGDGHCPICKMKLVLKD